jgi:hypothetical protein
MTKNVKPRYKIWNWEIKKRVRSASMSVTGKPSHFYSLIGKTNHREEGREILSSQILRIDFEAGEVETINSIYELQSGDFSEEETTK